MGTKSESTPQQGMSGCVMSLIDQVFGTLVVGWNHNRAIGAVNFRLDENGREHPLFLETEYQCPAQRALGGLIMTAKSG